MASLTPAGLAVKLPETVRLELFRTRRARRLRYFTGGPIKQEYAVLSRSTASCPADVRRLLESSIRFVCWGGE